MTRKQFILTLYRDYGIPKVKGNEIWDMIQQYSNDVAPISDQAIRSAIRVMIKNLAEDTAERFIHYFKIFPLGSQMNVGALRSTTRGAVKVVLEQIAKKALS
jgi:hypothetical protein